MNLLLPPNWVSVLVTAALDEDRPIIRPVVKTPARDYREQGAFPIVDQSQNAIAGWTNNAAAVLRPSRPVVVFGDHTRAFKYVDFPFATGADGTLVLNPSAEFEPRFFYFACLGLEIPARGYNRHYTVLREMALPKPPLDEQKKISSVLSKLQEAVEVESDVVRVTRELKRVALRQLLTCGLRGEPQKETEIGPVPESWGIAPLDQIVKARGGSAFPHSHQGKKSGELPFYKVSDMNLPGNEMFMNNANNRLDRVSAYELGAKPFPSDTIVFPKVGGALLTNKKRRLTCESLLDNNMMGVVSLDVERCSPDFLQQWFETVDLRALAAPGPLPSLNNARLYECQIPLPDSDEQREIATFLRTIDEKISHHEERQRLLRELFQTLLHDLMTARRRVTHFDPATLEAAA